jgi:hypothetical protein
MHQAWRYQVAAADGALESGKREVGVVGRTHRPADDAARVQVEQHGQVGPTLAQPLHLVQETVREISTVHWD